MIGTTLVTKDAGLPANVFPGSTDAFGNILSGIFDTLVTPPTTPNRFQKGCFMIKTDAANLLSAWYQNTGTLAVPAWTLMPISGGGSGITQLTGDGTAGPGSGVQHLTVTGWQGRIIDATSFGSPATAGIPVYDNGTGKWFNYAFSGDILGNTGNSITVEGIKGVLFGGAVGTPTKNNLISFDGTTYSTTPAGTATAVAGAATLNNQNGLITSEALTTAAGATYVLNLTSSAFSTTSQVIAVASQAGANTGIPYVTRAAVANGSCTITVTNIDPVVALNGTIFIKYLVL